MIQDQFVLPLGNLVKTAIVTATTVAAIPREGADSFHVEAIEGDCWLAVSGDASEDGTNSVIIPEGKDKSYTVSHRDTLSVLGGGKAVISFFK